MFPPSLGILIFIYLLSLYPLLRMFLRMVKLIVANPDTGLQFYRKMVTLSTLISAIDATYTITIIVANIYAPTLADALLIGLVPVIIKGLIMVAIWSFYAIQLGKTSFLQTTFWKELFHK